MTTARRLFEVCALPSPRPRSPIHLGSPGRRASTAARLAPGRQADDFTGARGQRRLEGALALRDPKSSNIVNMRALVAALALLSRSSLAMVAPAAYRLGELDLSSRWEGLVKEGAVEACAGDAVYGVKASGDGFEFFVEGPSEEAQALGAARGGARRRRKTGHTIRTLTALR